MEKKKINIEEKDNAMSSTLLQVAEFTGVAVVILCGAMILLKASKVMLKDIKDLGL